MTFIDSPLQPAYELSCTEWSMSGFWYALYPSVTDFHYLEVRNEFSKSITSAQIRPQWVPVKNALWTDVS